MIIVTGATSFIGSHLIRKLNAENFKALVAVDQLGVTSNNQQLKNTSLQEVVTWSDFMPWLDHAQSLVEFIFHVGMPAPQRAPSDARISHEINTTYAMDLWHRCTNYQIPLVYMSSAALYGLGEEGFSEEVALDKLKPSSKAGACYLNFDKWVIQQQKAPFFWAGLRLFTVYGPNAPSQDGYVSPVGRLIQQISTTGTAKLYKSHHNRCKDGEQSRDFIHVQDLVNGCYLMMHQRKPSGFYNMGSGTARTFLDLVKIICQELNKKESIEFIDPPVNTVLSYPYFMEAQTDKLKRMGFKPSFGTLEEGLRACIKNNV